MSGRPGRGHAPVAATIAGRFCRFDSEFLSRFFRLLPVTMTSRRFFTVLGLVAALLALAAVFNPSPERHRDAVRAAIGERNLLAKALGLGSLAALVSSYHSLGVASY